MSRVFTVLPVAPALAQPALDGKWAETRDVKCSEPLLITDTTMKAIHDESWQCSFPAAGEGGRSWTMRMACAMEGTYQRKTQT